jgi:hypothetical protein
MIFYKVYQRFFLKQFIGCFSLLLLYLQAIMKNTKVNSVFESLSISLFVFCFSGKAFYESLVTYGSSGPAVAAVCCFFYINNLVMSVILGLRRTWRHNCWSFNSWCHWSNQSTTWYSSWWLCNVYWTVNSCFIYFLKWICFFSRGRNVVHGSDSEKAAKKEIELWFKPEELLSYHRPGAQHLHDKYSNE